MPLNASIPSADGQVHVTFHMHPDTCPNCLASVFAMQTGTTWLSGDGFEIVYRCPKLSCAKFFIARYRKHQAGSYLLEQIVPKTPASTPQNESVKKTSPSFCKIFAEAEFAESHSLMEIAGVGYRKALEFLIKDYLLAENEDEAYQAEIKAKFLGRCISENVTNDNIKQVAKRAVWLGNDETHYVRVWEGKDLQDLKKLIRITTDWIELEQLTREIQTDMPTT